MFHDKHGEANLVFVSIFEILLSNFMIVFIRTEKFDEDFKYLMIWRTFIHAAYVLLMSDTFRCVIKKSF